MKTLVTRYYPGILLLLACMITGLFVCGDYGMSWDEPAQRLIGQVNYNYIFNHDPTLLSFYDKEYGAAFELPLIFIEKIFRLSDLRDIYIARHIATHFFFLFSVFCFYVLAYNIFRRQWVAILAFLMLALMPRMYAHSFFNTKDIPFLSAVVIALMLCHAAFTYKRPLPYLAAGIACGYFMGIRIMGIVPLSFILFFLAWDVAEALVVKREQRRNIIQLILFLTGLCGCLYIVWPLLWNHPIDNLTHCLEKLANKERANGNLIMGTNRLPEAQQWKYLPVWFSITVPPVWLFAGMAGIVAIITAFVKAPLYSIRNGTSRSLILFLLCFSVPVTTVIVFRSAIYDEWRHLYFIYPSFVMPGLYFIDKLMGSKWGKIVSAFCILQVAVLAWFMVKNHPYQYVYFNNLVSHKEEYLRKNYEFDYWGVSVQQALRYLLAADKSTTLKVCDPGFEPYVRNNVSMLPASERGRIRLCSMDECDYFITTYRYHPEDFPYPVFHKIQVLNSSIVCIYKAR